MAAVILIVGTCTYFAVGATVVQHMYDELDLDSYSSEWQPNRLDKVIQLLFWPFFAGAHWGVKWLMEDWFGGKND